jgi:hypothetical protein
MILNRIIICLGLSLQTFGSFYLLSEREKFIASGLTDFSRGLTIIYKIFQEK